jgi:hypothetical protein
MDLGIGPDDVVVGQDVPEPEFFDPFPIRADRAGISAELCLRKDHSYAHVQPLRWTIASIHVNDVRMLLMIPEGALSAGAVQ